MESLESTLLSAFVGCGGIRELRRTGRQWVRGVLAFLFLAVFVFLVLVFAASLRSVADLLSQRHETVWIVGG